MHQENQEYQSYSGRNNPVLSGLSRNAAGMGAGTLASRLLALLRDMLLAWVLGAAAGGALFWAAFRVVTAVRRLLADGGVSLGLAPLFRDMLRQKNLAHTLRLAGRTALLAALLAALPALLCAVFPGAALRLFAPGLAVSNMSLTAHSLENGWIFAVCLSYAPFAAGLAVLSALLHAVGSFKRPAIAPLLFNILMLAAAGAALGLAEQNALALCAWAVPLAGGVQLLFILPGLRTSSFPAAGISVAPTPVAESSAALPASATALLPHMGQGLLAVAAPQAAGLICMAIASGLESGTAALYFSERLVDLPFGLLGISTATALLPALSLLHASGDFAGFSQVLTRQIRLALFLALPAALGLMAVSPALIAALLGHGKFSGPDVTASANALLGYAPAVPGLVLARCLAAACFAQGTAWGRRRAGQAACIGAAATVLAAFLLAPLAGLLGLGIAAALGAWINAALLVKAARCRMDELKTPFLAQCLLAAVACFPAAWLCHASSLTAPAALVLGVVSGMLLYGALAWLFHFPESRWLRDLLQSLKKS